MATRKKSSKKKAAKKPLKKKAAKRPAPRRKPARKVKAAPRKKSAPKKAAGKKRPAAKKRAAPRGGGGRPLVVSSPVSSGPPPPPPDAIEVSGIYERVPYSENDPYQEVREIFNHFDRNKTGIIERAEFARICESLGVEIDEEELSAGFAAVDSDGDGKVGWDEFHDWWRSLNH